MMRTADNTRIELKNRGHISVAQPIALANRLASKLVTIVSRPFELNAVAG